MGSADGKAGRRAGEQTADRRRADGGRTGRKKAEGDWRADRRTASRLENDWARGRARGRARRRRAERRRVGGQAVGRAVRRTGGREEAGRKKAGRRTGGGRKDEQDGERPGKETDNRQPGGHKKRAATLSGSRLRIASRSGHRPFGRQLLRGLFVTASDRQQPGSCPPRCR